VTKRRNLEDMEEGIIPVIALRDKHGLFLPYCDFPCHRGVVELERFKIKSCPECPYYLRLPIP
jgi:hypothetical protein